MKRRGSHTILWKFVCKLPNTGLFSGERINVCSVYTTCFRLTVIHTEHNFEVLHM